MKFAIIRSEVSYTKGGAERYAANLCRELCELGHEVHVLAEIFEPDVHPDLIHHPVKVNRTSSSWRNLSFHENAQAIAATLGADQVIALSRSYPSDAFRVSDPLHSFWMELRYPGKFHRFLQSLNPRHRTILKMECEILNPENTRMIVTNSQLSKDLIARLYRYPAERIHVIYNGVDFEQFTPDIGLREGDSLELLFVGQDFKRKGLAPTIKALADVRQAGHDCTLRVIGRDNPTSYQKLARSLQVEPFITFEGPTREIQKAYRQADLLVFPSLYDPFANVVLEALACGLPALTTSTHGSSEVVDEGKNGYLIEGATDHQASDLAARIITFCELTPEARRDMRISARTAAEGYPVSENTRTFIEKLCH